MADYPADVVTSALTTLVAHHGVVTRAAAALRDADINVPEERLRQWKNVTHAEQYRRLEEKYGLELEQEAVANARQIMLTAHEGQLNMVRQVAAIRDPSNQAQALKALTDAKKSATQELLQLTGRPISPQGSEGTNEVVKLATKLIEEGLMRAAPGVSLEPVQVRNHAESVDG